MKLRKKEKLYIYSRDNKKCFYCGKELLFRQITLDHYLPLSKGGTNDVFNIVISCKQCNRTKGDSVPEDFGQIILELFITAVKDGIILGKDLDIDNRKLGEELLKVERIENISDGFVFQSKGMRFYIENNLVTKVVYLGGKDEYNYSFSWED